MSAESSLPPDADRSEDKTEVTNEMKVERLINIFEARRKVEPGLTRSKLAADCGWASPSTVTHYFKGAMPLNTNAIMRFAQRLQCLPSDIDPALVILDDIRPSDRDTIEEFLRAPEEIKEHIRSFFRLHK